MEKKRWICRMMVAIGAVCLAAGPVFSAPMMSSKDGLKSILESEVLTGLSGNVDFTIVDESPRFKNKNTFGVYSGDTFVELFNGKSGAGDTITVDLDALRMQLGSDTFGFYLARPYGKFENIYFSDPDRNMNGRNYLTVYDGIGKDVLIGFEDLLRGKSHKSDHFVVKISKPSMGGGATPAPVPEPATLLLLGSGMVGLAVARRRKK